MYACPTQTLASLAHNPCSILLDALGLSMNSSETRVCAGSVRLLPMDACTCKIDRGVNWHPVLKPACPPALNDVTWSIQHTLLSQYESTSSSIPSSEVLLLAVA
jgi:hypothetical protein